MRYDQVDIAGAKQLLTEAGVTGPIDVRLHVRGEQPASVQRVRPDEGVGRAGRLQPDRRTEPELGRALLPVIDGYDASLFGWQSTATGLA